MDSNTTTALISGNAIWFLWAYLGSLLIIGVVARFARREESMSDFFLSGRGMGFFVLLLTLYATQYSGNTLIGFSGKAYRSGFYFLVSVGFMMGVVGIWLIYAPKLQRLSRKFKFITPGNYFQHRYGSRLLTTFATILCIVALGNYILTNLKAIGAIMETATGGEISFIWAVVVASLIMVIYETLGGMRSVAWTDVLQGILLFLGCAAIVWGIYQFYGGLPGAADFLIENRQDLWKPPSAAQNRTWLSTLIMMSIGIALYPHAIQRIYAAKNAETLKLSFRYMVFLPLVTTFFMLVVGIVGAARIPGLDKLESDNISLLMLVELAASSPTFKIVAILFICAATAAIMSTVDSALLAVASMFSEDIYKPLYPNATQKQRLLVGKISSWVVMAIGALLAIVLPATIWRLIEIKLEILCQIAPGLILGLFLKGLNKHSVFAGMLAGTILVVFLMVAEPYLRDLGTNSKCCCNRDYDTNPAEFSG